MDSGCSGAEWKTLYRYDARGLLTGKSTPDADGDGDGAASDETLSSPDFEYKYDRAGNLRFELDPVRRGAGSSYLYTDYDAQGRAVEIGKTTGSFASANPDAATTGTKTAYRTFAYSGSQLLEETAPGAATYR